MLFGCPLELRTVGELTKIPPILEYLLDSVRHWPTYLLFPIEVGPKHGNSSTNSHYSKMEELWPLINEVEEAWTGVEESDRAIISNLVPRDNHGVLIMVCLVQHAI